MTHKSLFRAPLCVHFLRVQGGFSYARGVIREFSTVLSNGPVMIVRRYEGIVKSVVKKVMG